MNTPSESQKIQEAIQKLESTALNLSSQLNLQFDHKEFIDKLKHGIIGDFEITGEALKFISEDPSALIAYPLKKVLYQTYKARAYCRNGRDNNAREALIEAAYYTGFLECATFYKRQGMERIKTLESRRKGAIARREKHSDPVKKEAIRLIIAYKPEKGWESKDIAIFNILDDLKSFVSKNRISLVGDNLRATIKRWIKQDENFRTQFESELL